MKVINRLPRLCGEYGEKRRCIRNVYIIKFMVKIGSAKRYSKLKKLRRSFLSLGFQKTFGYCSETKRLFLWICNLLSTLKAYKN